MVQDDDYKSPCENKDATVATGLKTVTYSSDLDKRPAARNEPIKDTQTIKETIKGYHIGKRVRHSIDGPTNLDLVVTGFGIIGQGGSRTISGGKPYPKHCSRRGKNNLQRRHHSCPDKLWRADGPKRLLYVRTT